MASNNTTYLIYEGNAISLLDKLKDDSIQCIFTSPDPPRTDAEVSSLVQFFAAAQRVVTDNSTIFIQLGDYHDARGNLGGVPHYFVMAMKNEGWCHRSTLIWHRLNDQSKMEDTMRYRRDCEFIFMFAPDKNHYFNDRIGMHTTSLISVPPEKVGITEFKSGFPREVIRKCILPATRPGDIVLDPYSGTATTGVVALREGRHFIGFEIKQGYKEKIDNRLKVFGIPEIEDTQSVECK
jgi:DNA modification methylase